MRLRDLETLLQEVESFEKPKVELEQYLTSPHIAARFIHTAESAFGDIEDKVVLDLGCGTGMLSIACALMGAAHVIGFDIDRDALAQADVNRATFDDDLPIDFVQCNVRHHLGSHRYRHVATIVMNPPFGTRDQHADTEFLNYAFNIATMAVYSLHKRSTRAFLEKWAQRDKRVRCAQVLAELRYDIPAAYNFHRRLSKDIEVDLWRFQIA